MADRAGNIQHLNVNVSATGSTQLVAGQTGMVIVIVNYTLLVYGRVDVTLEDGNGIDRIGPYPFASNGGISAPDSNAGWSKTASGQALNIRLSANVQVGGSLSYRMMPDHLEM